MPTAAAPAAAPAAAAPAASPEAPAGGAQGGPAGGFATLLKQAVGDSIAPSPLPVDLTATSLPAPVPGGSEAPSGGSLLPPEPSTPGTAGAPAYPQHSLATWLGLGAVKPVPTAGRGTPLTAQTEAILPRSIDLTLPATPAPRGHPAAPPLVTATRGEMPVQPAVSLLGNVFSDAVALDPALELTPEPNPATSPLGATAVGEGPRGIQAYLAGDLTIGLPAPVAKSGATTPALNINAPPQTDQFGAELNNRLIWMARNDVQLAEIKLNPPHLGPMEVRVTVINGEANVTFSSPHAAIREALEAAIPRLRDSFAGEGLVLGDASVADHSLAREGDSAADFEPGPAGITDGDAQTADTDSLPALPLAGVGLVNLYA